MFLKFRSELYHSDLIVFLIWMIAFGETIQMIFWFNEEWGFINSYFDGEFYIKLSFYLLRLCFNYILLFLVMKAPGLKKQRSFKEVCDFKEWEINREFRCTINTKRRTLLRNCGTNGSWCGPLYGREQRFIKWGCCSASFSSSAGGWWISCFQSSTSFWVVFGVFVVIFQVNFLSDIHNGAPNPKNFWIALKIFVVYTFLVFLQGGGAGKATV